MRQYAEQKNRVGDAILLFRMGDFYETFYDDAILCSKVLGIALTSRNKHDDNPVPLAGIPYHALDSYLGRLVAAGYRVAISEQLEDPKQAKGVVRRDVVRIVTAGTLTDENLLDDRDDNVLGCVCVRGSAAGVAVVELASGRLEVAEVTAGDVLDHLIRARPAELLIDDDRSRDVESVADRVREACGAAVTRRPLHEFSAYQAERALLEHFRVATLAGFGFESMDVALCAAGGAIQYLQETQKTALSHITAVRRRQEADHVWIDHSSWRSLEIECTLRGGTHEGSLLHAIDRTVHPLGARKLRHWLREPLRSREKIMGRYDGVALLAGEALMRGRLRQRLRTLADVERITGRVALGRASPRDLNALGRTLQAFPTLGEDLKGCGATLLESVAVDLSGLSELAELLCDAIRDQPPNNLREGGFIADGFDAELDRLRAIGHDGQQWLADYQRRESQRTGIPSLKAGFNRVFGYYLEISNSARGEVPPEYVRKQTVKNAERYITEELKNYENEVLTAQERAKEMEYTLFERVRGQVAQWTKPLLKAGDALGRLDCLAGLAELAVERRYVRPEIVDDGRLEIRDGRHPVLDQTLGDAFVPNDTLMNEEACIFIITGPNMAGKSTYIRQVALLTLLAQVGSFVPAESMSFSLLDRIFARVGSTDEIMRGQSTFMVEMTEAANILHNATKSSLVILDELGRGTSTFDGLSLAWAITEHLANSVPCRTLVATHYHEMAELADLLRNVRNYNVAVREYPPTGERDGGIVFLHKIVEGAASQSYGIHVARLAGIPAPVIERSREVLDELQRAFERESRSPKMAGKKTRDDAQLPLFRDSGEELLQLLREIDLNKTTPMDALQRLQEWKARYG
jgi:DNA mismatch repair protein MutS